ncbi:MAG TPA: hypothetical protein VEL07_10295 [Planctomycetota bacterium]|nr:hypothetical protein [Planctomycetota bacterium]
MRSDSTITWSAADPTALRDPDTGRWRVWFSSGVEDRTTRKMDVRIFTAESDDGVTWTRQDAPALAPPTDPAAWDHTHVETPCVIRNPDPAAPAARRWLLFYAGGNTRRDALRGRPVLDTTYPYYAIGLAWSADGRTFVRAPGIGGEAGLVLAASAPMFAPTSPAIGDGGLADPDVVADGRRLVLYCSSYGEHVPTPGSPTGRVPVAWGISRAISDDGGLTWSFPQANPLPSLRRGDVDGGAIVGGEQPCVLRDAATGTWHLWFKNDTDAERAALPTRYFTAAGMWHATSGDGIAWTPDYSAHDFAWESSLDYERYGLLTGIDIVRDGAYERCFYSAWGTVRNPDESIFRVPLQAGGDAPAVVMMCTARRAVAPAGIAANGRR